MDRQEISETGAPEKVTIEEYTNPAVSKGEKEVSLEAPVIICEACGKGFLRYRPGGIDTEPLWWVGVSGAQGNICGGPLAVVSRARAIELIERYEREK